MTQNKNDKSVAGDIARIKDRASEIADRAAPVVDDTSAPEDVRGAARSAYAGTLLVDMAATLGQHEFTAARALAWAEAGLGRMRVRQLRPDAEHGRKFPPGETDAATEAHKANSADRQAQALKDLRRMLAIDDAGKYRTDSGRIKAAPLAADYANHPIFRAPLGDRQLRRLIAGWSKDGKLAKTST